MSQPLRKLNSYYITRGTETDPNTYYNTNCRNVDYSRKNKNCATETPLGNKNQPDTGNCTIIDWMGNGPSTLRTNYLEQLKPPQTERTMIRIRAIIIPKTISFIFIFCNHIFLLNCCPPVLKSCAWNKFSFILSWGRVNKLYHMEPFISFILVKKIKNRQKSFKFQKWYITRTLHTYRLEMILSCTPSAFFKDVKKKHSQTKEGSLAHYNTLNKVFFFTFISLLFKQQEESRSLNAFWKHKTSNKNKL